MITVTNKNKLQAAGIYNWALWGHPVSIFDYVFDTNSVDFRLLC